ncbi:MAG: transposase [Firmicutes bacterium]|nr:transposase [Bacillota bacterium]
MITNLDWAEEDVWHFYNQRCAEENYINEMKDGFGMDKIPSDDFHPNYAMMLLKGIAYNLVLSLKKESGTGRFARMKVALLRRELFWLVGVFVKHARGLVLKLSSSYKWQADYLAMRRNLMALVT